MRAAKYVCGLMDKGVSNPCVIRPEDYIRDLKTKVKKGVNSRCDCVYQLIARHGIRTTMLERRMERDKSSVKSTRNEVKRFMKKIEREWWLERTSECK